MSSAPWAERSADLADWAMTHLVNRADVFGHYRHVDRRTDGSTAYTDKSKLTSRKLARHFAGQSTGDILGLHSTARDDGGGCRSRWLAVDVDRHEDETNPEKTHAAALAIYERATGLGFRPILVDSNGWGGFHVWIIFDGPAPTQVVYAFGKWLTRDWVALGLDVEPETFPKQAEIADGDGYGNWLRLPGRHHTHDHWARVWEPSAGRWLDGDAAISRVVETVGSPVDLVPAEARAISKAPEPKPWPKPSADDGDDTRRAREILGHLDADMEYPQWLRVGMALTKLGEEGLGLWDTWSSGGLKYREGLCRIKWRSFKRTSDTLAVNFGTLVRMGKAAGWEDSMPKAKARLDGRPGLSRNGHTAPGRNGRGAVIPVPPANPSVPTVPEFPGSPRPVVAALLPVPPLPEAILPNRLRDWIEDIADRMQCTVEFVAVAVIVAIAIVVGRKLGIRPKRCDDWTVVANLWGMIVGRPGVMKSPAMEEATKPLHRLVMEAIDRHREELAEYERDRLVSEARRDAAKDELKKAAKQKGKTDAELHDLAALALATDDLGPPPMHRYVTSDATVAKLGELLRENPNGILISRDELVGFFRNLEKLGHESDRAFFLEGWNGTGWHTCDRIGRGTVDIPMCIGVLGGIQPGPLARCVREGSSGEKDDGLIGRFQLAVYPDQGRPFRIVDRWPDKEAKNRAFAIFKALDAVTPSELGAQPGDGDDIPYLRFDPDAQEFFYEWLDHLENDKLRADESPAMESHLAKYRSLMPGLALLFHLVDVADGAPAGPVTLSAAWVAAEWCDFLEAHARRIYHMAFEADVAPARALANKLAEPPSDPTNPGALPVPFRARDVKQRGWADLTGFEDVERALAVLEAHGVVKGVEVPPGPDGGRPTTAYYVNPLHVKRSGE